MNKSPRQQRIRKALKRGIGLILLLFGSLSGGLFITFRQNPFLIRFIPQGGLASGYSWELREGPDFDVYYARKANDETTGAGIYLGNMPNFFYDEAENLAVEDLPHEKGRLLSRDVTWIILNETNTQEHPFFRETQLEYHHGVGFLYTKVHIWVYASKQEELNTLVEGLRELQFKPMTSFWEILAYRISLQ